MPQQDQKGVQCFSMSNMDIGEKWEEILQCAVGGDLG